MARISALPALSPEKRRSTIRALQSIVYGYAQHEVREYESAPVGNRLRADVCRGGVRGKHRWLDDDYHTDCIVKHSSLDIIAGVHYA
jgi:hypothetical protein